MRRSTPCREARLGQRTWRTWEITELLRLGSFPAVSVLVSTTPSPSMTVTDETWLEDLLDEAVLRLRRDVTDPALLIAALRQLARAALGAPTGHGLALFVAAGVRRSCVLAAPPVDRIVIDYSFSIGDLFSPSNGLPTAQSASLVERAPALAVCCDAVCREVWSAIVLSTSGIENHDQHPHGAAPGLPARFLA